MKVKPAPCTLTAVASLENLLAAAARSRQGKSRRPDVEAWWQRREMEVLRLHRELSAGTWRPAGYRFFEIHDPKRRTIAAAPFADRVVHHAVCALLQPLLERRFIPRSFSCQEGKGTTAARDCVRRLTSRFRFVLKCDVRKFFDSIDHAVIFERLSRPVRCPGVLELIRLLLASHTTPGRSRPCGLPIGNLTSQLWGNFILDPLDHWITEAQQHGAYARYTDDFLLFSDDKPRLWELHAGIVRHLAALHLELALPKSRLLACREGVPFCGFLFHPGLAPRVHGATKRRHEARVRRLTAAGDLPRLTQSVFAWYQFSKEGNSTGLLKAWSRPRKASRSVEVSPPPVFPKKISPQSGEE